MTKEEKIKKAAKKYCNNINCDNFEGPDPYDAFIAGAEYADSHSQYQWISVKDRLPECNKEGKSKYCLALRFDGDLYVVKYLASRDRWIESDYICELIDGITHWMPIPKLPTTK